MTAHSNVSEVQENGCFVLFNLAFNEFVAVRIQLERSLALLEHNPSNFDAETALYRIKALIILINYLGPVFPISNPATTTILQVYSAQGRSSTTG
jgi:hypothetical protein